MSKSEAFEAWEKISDEEKALALKAVPKFADYCRKNPDYRPIHAVRFLSKKRFEGHAQADDAPPKPPPSQSEKIRLLDGRDYPKSSVLKAIDEWNSGGGWDVMLGARPDSNRTILPPEMLRLVTVDAQGKPFHFDERAA